MKLFIQTLAAAAAYTLLTASALAQSTNEAVGASPYVEIKNEAPPELILYPTPLPAGLARGIVWIQYRAENVRIAPVFGPDALSVSPRLGHLHVHVDNVPWGFVEDSDDNTISVAGLPPGQHTMRVDLVDTDHHIFAGCTECSKTVTFTVPEASH